MRNIHILGIQSERSLETPLPSILTTYASQRARSESFGNHRGGLLQGSKKGSGLKTRTDQIHPLSATPLLRN